MSYLGTVIEESLSDAGVLSGLKILSTRVETATSAHATPWLKKWTLHKVEIPDSQIKEVAQKISLCLDYSHKSSWYADFRSPFQHYIIFKDKIFVINKGDKPGYAQVKDYGLALGIPARQLDFPMNS